MRRGILNHVTTPQGDQIPREVYRLMSMTGANLHDALYCWKASNEELYGALQVYVERIHSQNQSLQPPPKAYLETTANDVLPQEEKTLPQFFKSLIDPGLHFMKGVMTAAIVLVLMEAL